MKYKVRLVHFQAKSKHTTCIVSRGLTIVEENVYMNSSLSDDELYTCKLVLQCVSVMQFRSQRT